MVSALDYRSSGLDWSPGWGHYIVFIVFLGKTPNMTVALSTKVYKWVLVNLTLGVHVALRWTSIPSRRGGGVEILPSHFMLQKLG